MKATSRGLRVPMAGSALTVAVCAAFGTGHAEATPIIIQVNQQLSTGPFTFDANHDGTPEFTFQFNATNDESDLDTFLNQVVGFNATTPKPGAYASLLHSGQLVDGSLNYVSGSSVILSGFSPTLGSYGQVFGNSGFAGLSFRLPGESGVHYGWAELHDPPGDLTLVEIGYETLQNTGIVTPSLAPEPGTLALLAAGAAGVLAMRRRQRAA